MYLFKVEGEYSKKVHDSVAHSWLVLFCLEGFERAGLSTSLPPHHPGYELGDNHLGQRAGVGGASPAFQQHWRGWIETKPKAEKIWNPQEKPWAYTPILQIPHQTAAPRLAAVHSLFPCFPFCHACFLQSLPNPFSSISLLGILQVIP